MNFRSKHVHLRAAGLLAAALSVLLTGCADDDFSFGLGKHDYPRHSQSAVVERDLPPDSTEQASPQPAGAGTVQQPRETAPEKTIEQPAVRPAPPSYTPPKVTSSGMLQPCWADLRARLAADGISGSRVDGYLRTLGPLTQSPMGRKMKELYKKKFFPAPPAPTVKELYYKGVVTEASAKKCRDFLARNRQAFSAAQARFGVPSEVAVALLFVETRLGQALADVGENAFQTLASMAESRRPDDIRNWLDKMPGWEEHRDWFIKTMNTKADWAYVETRALVRYMLQSNLTPDRFPGSIYGAIGLCQFMPSNISVYGADGTGDGVVDLFTVPDAVMSLSQYLYKHGWRPGISRDRQDAVIQSYNHSKRYSASILALADLVAGRTPPGGMPTAKPAVAAAAVPVAGAAASAARPKTAAAPKPAPAAAKPKAAPAAKPAVKPAKQAAGKNAGKAAKPAARTAVPASVARESQARARRNQQAPGTSQLMQ